MAALCLEQLTENNLVELILRSPELYHPEFLTRFRIVSKNFHTIVDKCILHNKGEPHTQDELDAWMQTGFLPKSCEREKGIFGSDVAVAAKKNLIKVSHLNPINEGMLLSDDQFAHAHIISGYYKGECIDWIPYTTSPSNLNVVVPFCSCGVLYGPVLREDPTIITFDALGYKTHKHLMYNFTYNIQDVHTIVIRNYNFFETWTSLFEFMWSQTSSSSSAAASSSSGPNSRSGSAYESFEWPSLKHIFYVQPAAEQKNHVVDPYILHKQQVLGLMTQIDMSQLRSMFLDISLLTYSLQNCNIEHTTRLPFGIDMNKIEKMHILTHTISMDIYFQIFNSLHAILRHPFKQITYEILDECDIFKLDLRRFKQCGFHTKIFGRNAIAIDAQADYSFLEDCDTLIFRGIDHLLLERNPKFLDALRAVPNVQLCITNQKKNVMYISKKHGYVVNHKRAWMTRKHQKFGGNICPLNLSISSMQFLDAFLDSML